MPDHVGPLAEIGLHTPVHTVSRFTSASPAGHLGEVQALPHRLIHITGDIHFTAIGLRSKPVV